MRFFVVTPEVRKSLNYNFLSYLSVYRLQLCDINTLVYRVNSK